MAIVSFAAERFGAKLTGANLSTLTFSPSTNCLVGHLLVVAFGVFSSSTSPNLNSVADNAAGAAHTWVVDVSRAGAAGCYIASVMLNHQISTTDTITLTFAGAVATGAECPVWLEEFSDVTTTVAPWTDKTQSGFASATSSVDTGTPPTTTQGDELAVAILGWQATSGDLTFTETASGWNTFPTAGPIQGNTARNWIAHYSLLSNITAIQDAGNITATLGNSYGAVATYKARLTPVNARPNFNRFPPKMPGGQ